jgi:DNA polymerase III delta prime subunit
MEEIEKKLDQFIINNRIPHIIFHGTRSVDKKAIINKFVQKIYNYNKEQIKENILSTDCSYGKGIKFIREDLKFFAKANISSSNTNLFKSIILYNADSLTVDAQSALRRCIETFSNTTRFFLIVENKYKLLNPILSRFCEIYVPEQIDNGRIITNNNYYDLDTYVEDINNKMTILNQQTHIEHNDLLNISTHFYENGVNCLHFIEWLKKQTPINMSDISDICLYFDKVKSDFRNESLLFLHILNYYYFRLKINIKS